MHRIHFGKPGELQFSVVLTDDEARRLRDHLNRLVLVPQLSGATLAALAVDHSRTKES